MDSPNLDDMNKTLKNLARKLDAQAISIRVLREAVAVALNPAMPAQALICLRKAEAVAMKKKSDLAAIQKFVDQMIAQARGPA